MSIGSISQTSDYTFNFGSDMSSKTGHAQPILR